MRTFRDQKGIALITALFFLIIMTALASGAIMLAGVQLKVSGGVSWWETSFAGGEGGINYVIPLLRDIYYDTPVSSAYVSSLSDTVLMSLTNELQNPESWNSIDSLSQNPDITLNLGGIPVLIDIDMVGTATAAGFEITPSMQYHKGSAQTASMGVYSVTSRASTPDGSVQSCLEQMLYIK